MSLSCGIVGLPNVGKSTLFNALTTGKAEVGNYPFCTVEPNVGVVAVPDPRLQQIVACIETKKIVPATIEFHDIAGLVRGASRGEGLGNKFLGHIRTVNAIVHVLRCFETADVTHVEEQVDAIRDLETVETELIIKDHETVVSALNRYKKLRKAGSTKEATKAMEMLTALEKHLQALQTARTFATQRVEAVTAAAYRDLHLLTAKPMLYVCNLKEGDQQNIQAERVKEHATRTGAQVIQVCATIEEELAQLEEKDREEFLAELGMTAPGLQKMVTACYALLGLQTYFTAGEKEIRAWTIKKGDTAPIAAGKIHSDFARGFICAETCTLSDLKTAGSKTKLKELGLIRTEGKDYIVQDGDILEFRFNV